MFHNFAKQQKKIQVFHFVLSYSQKAEETNPQKKNHKKKLIQKT